MLDRFYKQPNVQVVPDEALLSLAQSPDPRFSVSAPVPAIVVTKEGGDVGAAETGLLYRHDVVKSTRLSHSIGMKTTTFWLLVVLIVLVVLGAIGGGVGGSIALHQANNDRNSILPSPSPEASTSTDPPRSRTSTTILAPSRTPSPGCSDSFDGRFEIATVNATSVDEPGTGVTCGDRYCKFTLKDGILRNNLGQVYYIGHNSLFTVAYHPENYDVVYNGGFSICSDRWLYLGASSTFYGCDGSLYFRERGDDCYAEHFKVVPV